MCLAQFNVPSSCLQPKAREQATDLDPEGHFCFTDLEKHTKNRFDVCIVRENILFQKNTTVFLTIEIDRPPQNHI